MTHHIKLARLHAVKYPVFPLCLRQSAGDITPGGRCKHPRLFCFFAASLGDVRRHFVPSSSATRLLTGSSCHNTPMLLGILIPSGTGRTREASDARLRSRGRLSSYSVAPASPDTFSRLPAPRLRTSRPHQRSWISPLIQVSSNKTCDKEKKKHAISVLFVHFKNKKMWLFLSSCAKEKLSWFSDYWIVSLPFIQEQRRCST